MQAISIEGYAFGPMIMLAWLSYVSCLDIGNNPSIPAVAAVESPDSIPKVHPGGAFEDGLSPEARMVLESYVSSRGDSASAEKALAYLASFPSNTEAFISVFDPPDFGNLYEESHLYVDWFERCTPYNPELVGHKLVHISKGLLEGVDAISYIKHATVRFAVAWPKIFSSEIQSLGSEKVDGLVTFLANIEDHGDYPEYQKMIDALRHEKYDHLSQLLEQARSKRMSEKDH